VKSAIGNRCAKAKLSFSIRYRQPLREGETVLLKGWTEKRKGRLMIIRGEAWRKSDNELIAECTASFLVEQ
jgi:acyl-coenzyme A thioesterase PaaI-like protein